MGLVHDSSRRHVAPRRRARLLAIACAAAAAASGCDGCHGSKPYTPYKLSDTPPLAASSGAASPAPTAAADGGPAPSETPPSFAMVQGAPPPGDGASWPLEGGASIAAPTGRTFGEGLLFDADGDGKRDLLAWARAADGLRGEVLLVPGAHPEAPRTITALPADLAAPGCTAAAHVAQVGPRTIALDFEPRCGARLRDRAVRWIAILRLPPVGSDPSIAPEIGLEIRLAAPAEGESFQVAIDPRDRDGDGRADLTATLTLTGAPRPFPVGGAAAVPLAYFDRPAGLSRDPSEPEATFKSLTASIVADARRKTSAPRIAAASLALRRLHALLCDEHGKSAITTSAGPVRCGDARVVEEATMAEVEAALNLDDAITAAAALARLDALGPRRKDVDKLVAKSIPEASTTQVYRSKTIPAAGRSPAFAPLAFNAGGDVLLHTASGVLRIDRTSFTEAPVDAALSWPTRLASPPDAPAWTLTAVEERCDSPTLVARFETPDKLDVPLPILTPARCTQTASLPVDLLGRAGSSLLLAVRGEVVAIGEAAPPRVATPDALAPPQGAAVELGAARSPDGATFAYATPRGVLVATAKGSGRAVSARFWPRPLADGAFACVPSNKGERLACALADGAAIYERK